MKNHMARDQWGNWFHDLGAHPRKELMARIGSKHCEKMYYDSASDGGSYQDGYVIGGHWLRVYEVIPWRKPA